MSHLILALILNPEKLAKAQREIDTVLSPSRLPTFADRAALPYTECIMSETLRWGAPVPLSQLLWFCKIMYDFAKDLAVFAGFRSPA